MSDVVAKATNVVLYRDIPLKPPHEGANDTFYFTNATTQAAYFDSKAVYSVSGNSYQRIYDGTFKCKITSEDLKAHDLYSCNYMSFTNTGYENKRYYAFITGMRLISNGTLEITYRIDNMQTWWDEWHRKQCFVERCHSRTDTPGDNIQPEPFNPGSPVAKELWRDLNFTPANLILLIATTYDYQQPDETAKYGGKVLGGIPNAAIYIPFEFDAFKGDPIKRADGVSDIELSGWIYNMTTNGKFDAIIGGIIIPKAYYSSAVRSSTVEVKIGDYFHPQSGELDGYTPRNKKLYTAPYNYITLEDGLGNSHDLRIEFFDKLPDMTFDIYFATSLTMTMYLVPRNYNGKSKNNEEGLTLNAWPQATIATDTFKAYVSQNAGNMVGGLAGTVIGTIASAIANPASIAQSLIGGAASVAQTAGDFYDVTRKPPTVTGTQSDGTAMVQGLEGFTVTQMCSRAEYLKNIDSCFQMFGYAQNKVMTPPIHNRKKWTYVKTAGCLITGAIPAEANSDICSIFDNGVRFWADIDNFGNYDQDNGLL